MTLGDGVGSSRRFSAPSSTGSGAVSITLAATTNCDATGAICTSDGRPLSNSNLGVGGRPGGRLGGRCAGGGRRRLPTGCRRTCASGPGSTRGSTLCGMRSPGLMRRGGKTPPPRGGYAEPIVRFVCSTVGDGIAGVRVTDHCLIAITVTLPDDRPGEVRISVGPEGSCACRIRSGDTHLASTALDTQSFERLLKKPTDRYRSGRSGRCLPRLSPSRDIPAGGVGARGGSGPAPLRRRGN